MLLRILLVLLLPGLALAQDFRPAEPPPPDFSARQYIDSKGCVFLRDDDSGGWTARVSRDGAPICGYPPTLSARGLDGKPRLTVLDPDAGRSPAELLEEALAEKVLTNLRPGELASDPTPLEKLPDMGPEPDISAAPSDALRAALAAAPDIRRSIGAALQPNRRLCELLGYDNAAGPSAVGTDPSQGYCDSLPASDLSRLTFIRPVGSALTAPAAEAAEILPATAAPGALSGMPAQAAPKPVAKEPVPKPAKPNAVAPGKTPAAKPAAARGSVSPGKPVLPKTPVAAAPGKSTEKASAATAPTSKPATAKTPAIPASGKSQPEATQPSRTGMIPAAARYVQVGTYADAANADRAAQVVARMGYAVLRGTDRIGRRDVQFIMAGPFNDRQSIVKALDGIRRAGFKDAYPR
jgi:hypothetical protein